MSGTRCYGSNGWRGSVNHSICYLFTYLLIISMKGTFNLSIATSREKDSITYGSTLLRNVQLSSGGLPLGINCVVCSDWFANLWHFILMLPKTNECSIFKMIVLNTISRLISPQSASSGDSKLYSLQVRPQM